MRNYAFNSENPWDGSRPVQSRAETVALNHSPILKLSVIYWGLLIFFSLAFAGIIRADQDAEVKSKPRAEKLAREAKARSHQKAAEIGEEYVYLLEQLLYLSSDYCRYFDKLDDKVSDENYQALANMCARISKEEQYENVAKIIAEIDKLKIELSHREKELSRFQQELEKQSKEIKQAQKNQQALKLTISLREELEALDQQMEHDIVWRLKNNEINQAAIREYVAAVLNDSLIKVVRVLGQGYAPQVKVYHDVTGHETKAVVTTPDLPEENTHIPKPSELPDIADAPDPVFLEMPGHSDISKHGLLTNASFQKVFRDSIEVKSPENDIYITNAIGDLIISGWAQRKISATYVFAVSADLLQVSDEFKKEVQLRITLKQNKIYIESVAPPLADPKMRILESRLELTVPAVNDLFLSSTSGTINVNGIRNDITVKGASCNVDLLQVKGNVNISNSSGAISAGKIDGNVAVQNRMGPVTLFNCNGSIVMDNSFGAISISDCDGHAAIRNTGAISVDNHSGNIEITNRSGEIEINNLDGNLVAFNLFEPLKVKNVNGEIKLTNANSSVDAIGISGMTTISNRFGQINTSGISGPIQIENRNGDIIMLLNNSVSGPSNVISHGGQVLLTMGKKSNLLLTIESQGGGIDISGIDATIEDGPAGVQLAKLALGNGSNVLNVKAGNSKIFVKPVQKIALVKAP